MRATIIAIILAIAVIGCHEDKPTPGVEFTDQVQISVQGVVHLKAPSWQGSGFVVGPRLIVTARHIVEGGEDFVITTHDDHQVRASRAISDKEYDIGFIFIDDLECIAEERGTSAHKVILTPVPLGSIEDYVLGQDVYVIGSPGGAVHFNALTVGNISKLNTRLEDFGCPEDNGWASITTIDAVALNGNSGSPVFDMSGYVVGVLIGGMSDALNWIIPVDVFKDNIGTIELAFILDQYQREESIGEDYYEYYN